MERREPARERDRRSSRPRSASSRSGSRRGGRPTSRGSRGGSARSRRSRAAPWAGRASWARTVSASAGSFGSPAMRCDRASGSDRSQEIPGQEAAEEQLARVARLVGACEHRRPVEGGATRDQLRDVHDPGQPPPDVLRAVHAERQEEHVGRERAEGRAGERRPPPGARGAAPRPDPAERERGETLQWSSTTTSSRSRTKP